eukprot:6189109-Pleurochrysis_carterae.AAC.6
MTKRASRSRAPPSPPSTTSKRSAAAPRARHGGRGGKRAAGSDIFCGCSAVPLPSQLLRGFLRLGGA